MSNSSGPLVSIIIPIFNTPPNKLLRCFNSVLKQTYKEFEVLIIDSSESADTISFLNSFTEANNNFKLIKTFKGVSHQRNIGIDNSAGEFIAFIDSDDYISADYFEKLVRHLVDDNSIDIAAPKIVKVVYSKDVVCNKYDFKHCDGIYHFDGTNYFSETEKHALVHPVKVYRKSIIEDVRFPEDLNHGEDMFFNYFLCKKHSLKFIFDSGAVYFYCSEVKENAAKKRLTVSSLNLLEKLYLLYKTEINTICKKGIYYQFNIAFNLYFDICLREKNNYMLKKMRKYRMFQAKKTKSIKRKLLLYFPFIKFPRQNRRKKYVVFSFDDCLIDFKNNAYPILNSVDFPVSLNAISGYSDGSIVNNEYKCISFSDIKHFSDLGCEIAIHTDSHLKNTTIDDFNLCRSKIDRFLKSDSKYGAIIPYSQNISEDFAKSFYDNGYLYLADYWCNKIKKSFRYWFKFMLNKIIKSQKYTYFLSNYSYLYSKKLFSKQNFFYFKRLPIKKNISSKMIIQYLKQMKTDECVTIMFHSIIKNGERCPYYDGSWSVEEFSKLINFLASNKSKYCVLTQKDLFMRFIDEK